MSSDQILKSDGEKRIPINRQLSKTRKQTSESTPNSNQREYKTLEVKKFVSHRISNRTLEQGDFVDLAAKSRQNKAISTLERQLRYKTESFINDKSVEYKKTRKQPSTNKFKYKTDRKNILNRL